MLFQNNPRVPFGINCLVGRVIFDDRSHTHTHACMHAHMHAQTHARACMCTHTHTHTHTHTQTHTHTFCVEYMHSKMFNPQKWVGKM